MINFVEKQYASSKFVDRPRCTKDIMCDVSDPESETAAEQGLELIILSKDIPRNDGFAKLYKTRSQPHDLVLNLRREKYKCHQFVIS